MKLKSLILVGASFLILSACGPTKEEKAQEMAANYLKGVLYHFDSYEPVQTKIDSSFVSLTTDKKAIDLTLEMLNLLQSGHEYVGNIERAERTMEIWDTGYWTAHSRGEYRRAKEDRDKNQRLLDKVRERIQNHFSEIKSRQSTLKEGDFEGWKVYHKFKSLNGAGSLNLFGEYVFFCDEDFNERYAYSKDEYDAIEMFMTSIATSDDFSEWIEKAKDGMI